MHHIIHTLERTFRITFTVNALAANPRPRDAKELRGMPGRYRIRLSKWRIIYRVDDENQVVLILRVRRKVGPETYEDME
jgi:mRNA-degrading endonuclease RelE of RelBE toxin-antitoxin system